MFFKKRVQISHVSVITIAISDNISKNIDESWLRPTFLQLNGWGENCHFLHFHLIESIKLIVYFTLYRSHKKWKDSLETRTLFWGGLSGSASTFFKIASASCFWCYWNYNWLLDKYNIISTSVSEAVEIIPTDEKNYRKCSFMCFTLYCRRIQIVE